ncbi:MAG: DUF2029 domain-containing protein [Candidatus Eremiobacteraeota bacterium]|nr:DUF2029 domain-containing protein [Candidatus Eremiobacteraeota bacterium]
MPRGFYWSCLLAFVLVGAFYARGAFRESILDTFTCAGQVVLDGADPYRTEPLRTCERERSDSKRSENGDAVEPAPLPGYALAPFALLSKLPRKVEHAVFPALLLGAVILACVAIAKLTTFSFPALLVVFAPTTFLNILYGENTLFAVAGIALAGLAVSRRQYVLAAVAASCSMVQPHIGLVSCLALFLWVPRTRRSLLLCGVLAAALSVAMLGVERNIEYFRLALPGQALSEVYADDQYSLTRMLFLLGVSPALAIQLGSVSYVVMAIFGVWLAKRVSDTLNAPEFIPLLPAAAVLLGGTFVHDVQMSLAIPCAVVLACRARTHKWLAWFALPLVAGLFDQPIWRPWLLRLAPFAAVPFLTKERWSRHLSASGAAAAIAICALFVGSALRQPIAAPIPMPADLLDGRRIASDAWGAYLRSQDPPPSKSPEEWIQRVPTWLGLICILVVAAGQLKERRGADRELEEFTLA